MTLLRKRRTREHIIADLSVNFIERQVLLCGHTVERIVHDYGYDLFWFTFSASGEPEAGEIRLQVKATEQVRRDRKTGGMALRVQRADVAHWLSERLPVIVVLYDVKSDTAFWLDIQSYFRRLPGFNLFAAPKTITLYFAQADVFDPDAARGLAALKNQMLSPQGDGNASV